MLFQLPFDSLQYICKFLELPVVCQLSRVSRRFNIEPSIQVIYQTKLSKREYIDVWLSNYNNNMQNTISNIKNTIIKIYPYYTITKLHQKLYYIYTNLDTVKYYPYIKSTNDNINKNIRLYKTV